MGQHVVVRTHDGMIHHGILHSATNDGIYLRPMQGRGRLASGTTNGSVDLLADLKQSDIDAEEAWWPFLFFPWWGIGGFWPWGWWW